MLRIMTLDLNYYVDKHGDWPTRREIIVHRIQDMKPDAIAFQAVRKDPALYGGADQIEQLARYLPDYRHAVFEAAVTYDDGSQNGSGFLSRIGLRNLPSTALSFRPGLDDQNQRILLHARLELPGDEFHLFNAHFSWVKEQAVDNVTEVLHVADAVEELALLVGDMNQTPDSEAMQKLRSAQWLDAWVQLQPNRDGFTFEAPTPTMRIDYAWANFLLAPHLSHIEIVAGYPTEGQIHMSDHCGLLLGLDVGMHHGE